MNKDIFRVSALSIGILAAPSIIGINNAKAAEIAITGDGRVDCSANNPSPAPISEQILPGTSLNIGTSPERLSLRNEGGKIVVYRINTGTPSKLFEASSKRGEFLPQGELRTKALDIEFSAGPYAYYIKGEPKDTGGKGKDNSVKINVSIDCNIEPKKDNK